MEETRVADGVVSFVSHEGEYYISVRYGPGNTAELGVNDLRTLAEAINLALEEYDDCPYTFSHTRHLCGRESCRER